MTIPVRVSERLSGGLKRFQPILSSAKNRDVNEHDTVVIVVDMLAEVFGFDKYSEVTREYCVRGTFCDLAIKIDGKLRLMIEVKAIGSDLKDNHVKQVVDYAANEGVEWVVLTNGVRWQVYRVFFGKPIDRDLVLDLDIETLSSRNKDSIESLFLLSRESIVKSALEGYHDIRQATSRFFLAAVIMSDPVLESIRRELRRVSQDVKISTDEIRLKLANEVLKRDALEGPDADTAKRKVQRSSNVQLRTRKTDEPADQPHSEAPPSHSRTPEV